MSKNSASCEAMAVKPIIFAVAAVALAACGTKVEREQACYQDLNKRGLKGYFLYEERKMGIGKMTVEECLVCLGKGVAADQGGKWTRFFAVPETACPG